MASNAYLVADGPAATAFYRRQRRSAPLLERVERDDITITHVLVTHGHGDHVVGVEQMAERFGVPLLRWPELGDGEWSSSGDLRIDALYTPGHCRDHLALPVNGSDVFTADVLFKGTLGGTSGGGPNGFADMKHSVWSG